MTRDEIISGLQFTVDMFLFDLLTGEVCEPRNDDDKTTVDACRGAIELLQHDKPKSFLSISKLRVISSLLDSFYSDLKACEPRFEFMPLALRFQLSQYLDYVHSYKSYLDNFLNEYYPDLPFSDEANDFDSDDGSIPFE